ANSAPAFTCARSCSASSADEETMICSAAVSEGGPCPARRASEHTITESAANPRSGARRDLRAEFPEECANIIHEELRLLETGEVPTLGHLRVVHQIETSFEDAAGRI